MKIINRKEFLKLPANVLFSKYTPCCFGDIYIKDVSIAEYNDFYYTHIHDAINYSGTNEYIDILTKAVETGKSIDMDLESIVRDGLYEDDELFAVWEKDDVSKLIARLQKVQGI